MASCPLTPQSRSPPVSAASPARHGPPPDVAPRYAAGTGRYRIESDARYAQEVMGNSQEITLGQTMLFTTVLVYGISVMRSVLEEKNSRVMEVLLSALTPKELMAGKIIGVAAVGLTQIAIWAALGAVLGGPYALAARGALQGVSIPPATLIFFAVFFLLGYLLYSSMYAALGALVSTDQEGQQLQIVVMGPLLFAYLMMFGVLRQPNATFSLVLSLVPFFAPLLMYMRIMVQPPPAWQVALSIALMVATIYGMVSLCARIYRIGILMYGKRPTLPEIWKWLRYT